MNFRAALLVTLLLAGPALAQTPVSSLHGRFVDPTTKAAVAGVQVKVTNPADTSDVHRATGKDDGTFEITGLGRRSYRLEATRLGYAPLRQDVRVDKAGQDAGVLALTPMAVNIAGITVNESPAPAIQKADTTEFSAGAVKTNPDATAEDLVRKMPGVTVENGQVKANGEQVQQVLVNGRPFMGTDPTAAMRNLPADVIDRIQVYDRMSDQAEFSGFDDGQSQRTMNFILRDRRAKFGKLYGGGGDRDRYQAGGNATIIHGATRLTLLGLANNINQQNFSPQDLFGALAGNGGGGGGPRIMMFGGPRPGGARGPGGGPNIIRMGGGLGGGFDPGNFFVGQQDGLTTTRSGGANYTGQWGRTLSLSSSVFANGADNDNTQTLSREYLPPQDSTAFYDQLLQSSSRNTNQRFDGRVEWAPDSSNSVILTPRLYFQDNHQTSLGSAGNFTTLGSALNGTNNDTRNATTGDNLSGHAVLRHRFAKRGRNVSADFGLGHTLRDGDGSQASLTDYFEGGSTTSDTLDQRSTSHLTTNSFSTRVAWTEPLAPGLQGQLTWNPSASRSASTARAFNYDPISGSYALPDSALSNTYENRNTSQSGGFALLYTTGPWRLLGRAEVQHTALHSEQTWPEQHTVDRSFDDVLPSFSLNGNLPNRRNVRLSWNTSTTAPSIGQLQNVVDNSNPLSLSTGNPGLRQTYNQNVTLRLSETDPARSTSRFLFLNLNRTGHPIVNSTFTAPRDTTVNGVFLARGTQLTQPVNLDAAWSGNVFGVYSRPIGLLKSILNLNGGATYSRTPARVNTGTNLATSWALRSGAVVSSNISPNLDFTVSYQGTYNLARNSLSAGNRGDYYSHSASLRLNTIVHHGIVLRQELTNNLQSGVPGQYGQNVALWNTTLGKKFLKDEKAELRVTATDVLGQDRSVSRSFSETYVQDSRNRTLGRFVQAVFTYTFR
jgi:hypothetical protein